MATRSCRECSEAVSTLADDCPHCGARYPTEERAMRELKTLVWAGIATVIIFWILFR